MTSTQLVFTVVFMLGLVLVFVVMPWKTLYQRRIQHGLPLLDEWSFAPSRLDLFDMLFTLVIYFSVQVIGITIVVKNPDPNDIPSQFIQLSPFNSAAGLCTLLTLFLVVPAIYLRRGDLRAMRLRFDRLTELIRIGFYAAVLLVPVTMFINALVSIFITPYSHPVIETLLAEASVTTLIYTVITVVIAAPLVEEFVFRGILLTYLHRVFSGTWRSETFIVCRNSEMPSRQEMSPDLFQVHGANLLTSLLFSALHIGQGAAYIPLFILSFGIGYVGNKTGSIIPCVIIHMVLNGISTIPLIYLIIYQS